MALSGKKCKLQVGDGATPEVFSDVAGVVDLNGVDLDSLMADASDRDSANDTREFIAVELLDPGQVTFTIHYDPGSSGHQSLLSDMTAFTLRNFKLVFNNTGADEIPFSAYVQHFSNQHEFEGKEMADLTLQVTGLPTLPS